MPTLAAISQSRETLGSLLSSLLRKSDHPLRAKELQKLLSLSDRPRLVEIELVLVELEHAGEAHAWPTSNAPRYWIHGAGRYLDRRILAQLALGPLTGAGLAVAIRAKGMSVPRQFIHTRVQQLIASDDVTILPRIGTSPIRYGLAHPEVTLVAEENDTELGSVSLADLEIQPAL